MVSSGWQRAPAGAGQPSSWLLGRTRTPDAVIMECHVGPLPEGQETVVSPVGRSAPATFRSSLGILRGLLCLSSTAGTEVRRDLLSHGPLKECLASLARIPIQRASDTDAGLSTLAAWRFNGDVYGGRVKSSITPTGRRRRARGLDRHRRRCVIRCTRTATDLPCPSPHPSPTCTGTTTSPGYVAPDLGDNGWGSFPGHSENDFHLASAAYIETILECVVSRLRSAIHPWAIAPLRACDKRAQLASHLDR